MDEILYRDRAPEPRDPETLDMFDSVPYQAHSETSREAADEIGGKAGTIRRRVLDCIRSRPDGMTDAEVQSVLGLEGSTQRPRRVRLVELGLVRDSGRVRTTHSGRKATVWEAV